LFEQVERYALLGGLVARLGVNEDVGVDETGQAMCFVTRSTFVGFVAVKATSVQLGGGLQAVCLKPLPLLATPGAARQLLQVVAHNSFSLH
jgi:hypothetical protein